MNIGLVGQDDDYMHMNAAKYTKYDLGRSMLALQMQPFSMKDC